MCKVYQDGLVWSESDCMNNATDFNARSGIDDTSSLLLSSNKRMRETHGRQASDVTVVMEMISAGCDWLRRRLCLRWSGSSSFFLSFINASLVPSFCHDEHPHHTPTQTINTKYEQPKQTTNNTKQTNTSNTHQPNTNKKH